ncbi:MAG: phage terminase large subunit family protein [Taibaiella sp.]|nr:phage terminase large subunit family protein [Taibaiella sp.]
MTLEERLEDILDFGLHRLSDVSPSVWAQEHMIIRDGKFQGPLSYKGSPYSPEILDCLDVYNPAQEVVIMASAQWGKTKGIIEPAIAYRISEHPCKMGYLTGHSDLSEEAMNRLDSAIDNSGLRPLIRKQGLQKRNMRTGDTLKSKEFPGGSLIAGSATNHKLLRQRDWQFILVDDVDAAKMGSEGDGSTVALIRARAKSFGRSKKILWVSTPTITNLSIIEELFLKGDQRRWHIPCPCCGGLIVLKWECKLEGTDEKAGMTWELDEDGVYVEGSARYRCQMCGDTFDERGKLEWNARGMWIPMVKKAKIPGLISFHMHSLYAMPGMNDWGDAVKEFLEANPPGQPRDEKLHQTFMNLTLGESYQPANVSPKAGALQRNKRPYDIGIIPERQSLKDGNGRIVLVTCAADLNGKVEDGRLDFQVWAWAENGARYNVCHGSIGTFIPAIIRPRDYEKRDRLKWTYESVGKYRIFDEFEAFLNTKFPVDKADGDKYERPPMGIMIAGVDTGKTYNNLVYSFLDRMHNKAPGFVHGVKGRADEQYFIELRDVALIKRAKERSDTEDLWILEVGMLKDKLYKDTQLNWIDGEAQPEGFLNFPQPGKWRWWPADDERHELVALYDWDNFYSHFESEQRVIVSSPRGTAKAIWEKVQVNSQNHQLDCAVYNLALKDIWLERMRRNYKDLKDYTWGMYVSHVREFFKW